MKIILKEDKIVCYYSFIYNNIYVYIEPNGYNDSVISIPYEGFKSFSF